MKVQQPTKRDVSHAPLPLRIVVVTPYTKTPKRNVARTSALIISTLFCACGRIEAVADTTSTLSALHGTDTGECDGYNGILLTSSGDHYGVLFRINHNIESATLYWGHNHVRTEYAKPYEWGIENSNARYKHELPRYLPKEIQVEYTDDSGSGSHKCEPSSGAGFGFEDGQPSDGSSEARTLGVGNGTLIISLANGFWGAEYVPAERDHNIDRIWLSIGGKSRGEGEAPFEWGIENRNHKKEFQNENGDQDGTVVVKTKSGERYERSFSL